MGAQGGLGLDFSTSKESLTRDYVAKVLRPALGAGGNSLLDLEDVVPVDRDFLCAVAGRVAPERPDARSRVSEIDVRAAHAALLPNYNVLPHLRTSSNRRVDDNNNSSQPSQPVYSVEIKPKCGFLPSRENLIINNNDDDDGGGGDGDDGEEDIRLGRCKLTLA